MRLANTINRARLAEDFFFERMEKPSKKKSPLSTSSERDLAFIRAVVAQTAYGAVAAFLQASRVENWQFMYPSPWASATGLYADRLAESYERLCVHAHKSGCTPNGLQSFWRLVRVDISADPLEGARIAPMQTDDKPYSYLRKTDQRKIAIVLGIVGSF